MRRCISPGGQGPRRLLLIGMGKCHRSQGFISRAATLAARNAQRLGVGEWCVLQAKISPEEIEAITSGLIAGAWEYADLKSPLPEAERKKPLEKAYSSPATQTTAAAVSRMARQ